MRVVQIGNEQMETLLDAGSARLFEIQESYR
jgi:hypothetical protein